ncbi:MAG: hypothetical protein AAGU01_09010, partial [Clostridiaceae bacterium]
RGTMKKIILIFILLFCIPLIQGCNDKEGYTKPTNVEDGQKSYEENFNKYKDFVSANQSELTEIIDWLNTDDGYFYLYTDNNANIDTDKGKKFKTDKEMIEKIATQMKKGGLTELSQEESEEDVSFLRIEHEDGDELYGLGDRFEMHWLIYHKGELNIETQGDWRKIADNYYYCCTIGE